MKKKIINYAPYDLNDNYGNTIRPIQQIFEINKSKEFSGELLVLKRNEKLKIPQLTIKPSLLSKLPSVLKTKDTSFLFELPILRKINPRCDILHINNYYSILSISQNRDFKLIVDFHGWKSIALTDLSKRMKPLKKEIYQRIIIPIITQLETKSIKSADGIIVASENIKKIIKKKYKISNNKIRVIHNHVTKQTNKTNRPKEIFVSVIGPFTDKINNVIPFIKQLSNLTKIEIRLIGKIKKTKIKQISNCPNIKIEGRVPSKKYLELISNSTAVLLPYTINYRGGGPRNKLLEAGSFGIPIISTDGGAKGFENNSAIIRANSVKEFAEKINEITKKHSKLTKYGKQIKKSIDMNYNSETETKKLIQFYKEILQR